jgi:hypothetical protein
MKRKIIMSIVIGSCFYGCVEPEIRNPGNKNEVKINVAKTDLELLDLKGKVHVLKQEEFMPSLNENILGIRTGNNSFSYKFDEVGRKIQEQNYDSLGTIKSTALYQFSKNGLKLGKKIVDLNERIIKSYNYEYDKLGQVFKYNVSEQVDGEMMKYYVLIGFDDLGNEISETIFTATGEKVANSTKVYENNTLIQITLFDNMDSPTSICRYENDSLGNPILERYFMGNGMAYETHSNEYVYDNFGNWIKKVNSLDEIHMRSIGNKDKKKGVQNITIRTFTYH